MGKISFVVYGGPVAQPRQRHTPLMKGGSPVIGRGGRPVVMNYTPKKAPIQQWKSDVKTAAIVAWNHAGGTQPFDGPVELVLDFYLPRPKHFWRKKDPEGRIPIIVKPDLENIAKGCMDALTGVAYFDDRQVCDLHVRKFYHEKNKGPRAEITIGQGGA